jgi:hypothetical protein
MQYTIRKTSKKLVFILITAQILKAQTLGSRVHIRAGVLIVSCANRRFSKGLYQSPRCPTEQVSWNETCTLLRELEAAFREENSDSTEQIRSPWAYSFMATEFLSCSSLRHMVEQLDMFNLLILSVTLRTIRFNIQKFWMVLTLHVSALCGSQKKNSNFCLTQY